MKAVNYVAEVKIQLPARKTFVLALFAGADVTWGEFVVNNLVSAMLGNIVGRAICVEMAY